MTILPWQLGVHTSLVPGHCPVLQRSRMAREKGGPTNDYSFPHLARDTRHGAVGSQFHSRVPTTSRRQHCQWPTVQKHPPCPLPHAQERVVSPIFTPSPGADSSSPQPARRHGPEITSCHSPGSSLVRLVSANRWGGTPIWFANRLPQMENPSCPALHSWTPAPQPCLLWQAGRDH